MRPRFIPLAFAFAALVGAPALFLQGADAAMSLTLVSSAFTANGDIPSRFTCDGESTSPPLAWSGVPQGTKSLVLIIHDPDASDPKAPKRDWVHWILYNLPPETAALAENADKAGLPAGASRGLNDAKAASYDGPCPPVGRHRYVHELYALDTRLDLAKPNRAELEAAMQGHVLAQAELIGTYQKADR